MVVGSATAAKATADAQKRVFRKFTSVGSTARWAAACQIQAVFRAAMERRTIEEAKGAAFRLKPVTGVARHSQSHAKLIRKCAQSTDRAPPRLTANVAIVQIQSVRNIEFRRALLGRDDFRMHLDDLLAQRERIARKIEQLEKNQAYCQASRQREIRRVAKAGKRKLKSVDKEISLLRQPQMMERDESFDREAWGMEDLLRELERQRRGYVEEGAPAKVEGASAPTLATPDGVAITTGGGQRAANDTNAEAEVEVKERRDDGAIDGLKAMAFFSAMSSTWRELPRRTAAITVADLGYTASHSGRSSRNGRESPTTPSASRPHSRTTNDSHAAAPPAASAALKMELELLVRPPAAPSAVGSAQAVDADDDDALNVPYRLPSNPSSRAASRPASAARAKAAPPTPLPVSLVIPIQLSVLAPFTSATSATKEAKEAKEAKGATATRAPTSSHHSSQNAAGSDTATDGAAARPRGAEDAPSKKAKPSTAQTRAAAHIRHGNVDVVGVRAGEIGGDELDLVGLADEFGMSTKERNALSRASPLTSTSEDVVHPRDDPLSSLREVCMRDRAYGLHSMAAASACGCTCAWPCALWSRSLIGKRCACACPHSTRGARGARSVALMMASARLSQVHSLDDDGTSLSAVRATYARCVLRDSTVMQHHLAIKMLISMGASTDAQVIGMPQVRVPGVQAPWLCASRERGPVTDSTRLLCLALTPHRCGRRKGSCRSCACRGV